MTENRPFAQKSTVRSRREAEKRAAEARRRYEEALRAQNSAPFSSKSSQSHFEPPRYQDSSPAGLAPELAKVRVKPRLNPNRRLAAYVSLTTLAALGTVLYGAPLFGRGTNLIVLIGGGAAVFVFGERALHWFSRVSRKAKIIAASLPALLAVFFILGVRSQVVIDGTVFPAWSPEVKAYKLSNQIYDDLVVLRNNDAYLTLPAEQARSRSSDITAAAKTSAAIAAKWNPSSVKSPLSSEFLTVMNDINSSAYAQSKALDLLGQNVLQYDAGRANDITSLRQASVETFITATNDLRTATSPYGFDPTAPKGPVE